MGLGLLRTRAGRRLTVASVWLAIAMSAAIAAQSARQRTVIASVLDRAGAPVATLGPADFTVREDGIAREVLSVAPAPPPTHVVILADDSQATSRMTREIREALNGFANQLADATPAPLMRLTTFGDRPTVRVDFTGFSGVSREIDRLTPATGSGSTFLDAVVDTCRDLRSKKIEGAVLVAWIAEGGPEFSSRSRKDVEDALMSARASLWTVVLQDVGATLATTEARDRAAVAGDVARASGGLQKTILAAPQLPTVFTSVADLLLGRVAVTYGRPDALIPPKRVEVTGRDRSWQIQVSRWPSP